VRDFDGDEVAEGERSPAIASRCRSRASRARLTTLCGARDIEPRREPDVGGRVSLGEWTLVATHGSERRHFDVHPGFVVLEQWLSLCRITVERGPGVALQRHDPHDQRGNCADGASGVEAISCYGSSACAILDSAKTNPRFLVTENGGATWSQWAASVSRRKIR